MIWLALLAAAAAVVLLALRRRLSRPVPGLPSSPALASFRAGIGLVTAVLGVGAVLAGLASAVVVVPAGHAGVVVLFGDVQPRHLEAGLRLRNPFAQVLLLSVRTETYTMSGTASEGDRMGDDAVQVLSSDGLAMPLEVTFAYQLVPDDAPAVYKNLGTSYVEKILRPAARTSVREAASHFTAQEAYSTRREELTAMMRDRMEQRVEGLLSQMSGFDGKGFVVSDVMLRNVGLPDRVKNAIEEKLEAQQQAERMSFVLEKERQEAERKRIEAQGVADFQRIVAEGISDPLLRWKGIEATEKLATSQNAKVVVIGAGENGLPIILGGNP